MFNRTGVVRARELALLEAAESEKCQVNKKIIINDTSNMWVECHKMYCTCSDQYICMTQGQQKTLSGSPEQVPEINLQKCN